jgi:predicted transposase YdaD
MTFPDVFLLRIYTSLLISRFKNKTLRELTTMLQAKDITKTRAAQELIAMGKAEGKAEGKTQTLLGILNKRLGKLPKNVTSQIERLNYLQLEQLDDLVLDVPDIAHLSEWLRHSKRKS